MTHYFWSKGKTYMQKHIDNHRREIREVPVLSLHLNAVEGACKTSGCFSSRRHGSAFCQGCSDRYNKRLSIAEVKNPQEAEALRHGVITIKASLWMRVIGVVRYVLGFSFGFLRGIWYGLFSRRGIKKITKG